MKQISIFFFIFLFGFPLFVFSQELIQDTHEIYKARVEEVVSEETREVPGTDVTNLHQTLRVKILNGVNRGETITVENDYLKLKQGETFYLNEIIDNTTGARLYSVADPYRLPSVIFFAVLFVGAVLIFGGVQGVRGLISLIGSFVLILYVLLPGILGGYSPILLSIGVSSLIIIVGSYVTHGFNKTTTAAVVGMIVTVIITGTLAYIAVDQTQLSGFDSDESVYLNFNTGGSIDFAGLLLGGIMIGLLGVLYDVAISQAISVEELHRVGPHLSRHTIYKRAIRIGREHIGALVDTLAIAYVGASLPLLLLFYSSTAPIGVTLNKEIFSSEIIRAIIGSIGLILAIPITTLISTIMLIKKDDSTVSEAKIKNELEAVEHSTHHH